MSQIFLLPMTDYAPTIRFKTAALVMALEQRILSCITCCRFQILQSENASWLLHCLAKMCWRARKTFYLFGKYYAYSGPINLVTLWREVFYPPLHYL